MNDKIDPGAQQAGVPEHEGAPTIARRILMVEDNVDANETLGAILKGEGHHVISAYDGISGLGLARKNVIDVMLCDIGLPGLDGLQLLAQLRATTEAHIPFAIAISGNGTAEDRQRAASAGYGQFFLKPVDVDALLKLISSEAVTRFIAEADRRRS